VLVKGCAGALPPDANPRERVEGTLLLRDLLDGVHGCGGGGSPLAGRAAGNLCSDGPTPHVVKWCQRAAPT
jgi:hypothetical protein